MPEMPNSHSRRRGRLIALQLYRNRYRVLFDDRKTPTWSPDEFSMHRNRMAEAKTPSVARSNLSASGRGRMGQCHGVQVASTGSYIPTTIVTNEDLRSLGFDSEWIVQRTGIRERRHAHPKQASSDLALEASLRCLAKGGIAAADIDLIVLATISPDHLTPSTACLLQQRLGCTAPAMDISAACTGFVYALITGAQFVQSGAAKNVLVVGSEVMSRTVDAQDIKTYPLFGDAAGAVVLQASSSNSLPSTSSSDRRIDTEHESVRAMTSETAPGILSFSLGSEGCKSALCIPGGGSREPLTISGLEDGLQFMQMDGRGVFKWAVRIVVDACQDVLTDAGYTIEEVDWVVLHQANVRIIDAAMNHFNIPKERVIINLDRFGNTSAASIPLVLDEINQQGKLKRGDLILMCGFGAGLTWGSALVRW